MAVPSVLFPGLSACLLGRCLLKSVICCVRVSNHVPCRRVALLASRSARCGAGADVIWVCRLQCRHADAAIAKQSLQSLCVAIGSYRLGADARGRAPRAAAIFPPASTLPVTAAAAADRGTAILSDSACRRFRGGRGLSSYAPPTHQPLETTATVAPRSVAAVRAPAQAGTTIIVGTSDTLETLSRRYNVSSAAILQADGDKGPRALSPGQQLIIPRQTAAVAAPAPARALAPASKPVVAAAPTVHVVNRGDTLLSIARRNKVTAPHPPGPTASTPRPN